MTEKVSSKRDPSTELPRRRRTHRLLGEPTLVPRPPLFRLDPPFATLSFHALDNNRAGPTRDREATRGGVERERAGCGSGSGCRFGWGGPRDRVDVELDDEIIGQSCPEWVLIERNVRQSDAFERLVHPVRT